MTESHGRFICDEHIEYQLEAGFDRIPSKLWRHVVLQRLRHLIRRFVEIFEITIAEHPGPNVRAASNDGDLCEKRINRMFDLVCGLIQKQRKVHRLRIEAHK